MKSEKLRRLVALPFMMCCATFLLAQQAREVKNLLEGNAQAIANGKANYRANCSQCHGLDATGGLRAPTLVSGKFTHGASDADLFSTILHGVPSTLMPANDLTDDETWEVIAFLRSMQPKSEAVIAGDAQAGEKYFWSDGGCASCHMVRGRGGRLGPDLSRVSASRSTAYITESLREPSKQLSDGLLEPGHDSPIAYDTVTITLSSGEKIIGIAKNEDTFSIQLLDLQGELRLFSKSDLQNIVHEHKSLMPRYTEVKLSNPALQDLLAYLETLRGE